MVSHRRLRGDPDWGFCSESQRLPGADPAGQRLAVRAEPPGPGETRFGAAGLDLVQGAAGIDPLGASPVSPGCWDCARSVRSRRDHPVPVWLPVSVQYVLHQRRVRGQRYLDGHSLFMLT